jgi:hypothetical protein
MIRSLIPMLSALLFGVSPVFSAAAQEVLHETPGYDWPSAKLGQVSWLAGTWRGTSDDGVEVLESWVGPLGVLMAGVSLEYVPANENEEASNWSENLVIASNGHSLALHSSTFEAEFGGFEYIERRLLRIEEGGCRLYFHGVTYICERRQGGDQVTGMTVHWKEQTDDFNPSPELFTYSFTRIAAD